jgi:hypothetical protein
MHLKKLRELQLAVAPQQGRPAYVSSASGLVRVGSNFYVVPDDELQLGVFPITANAPGSLIRLIEGELPLEKEERKQAKPDFEVLIRLPGFDRYPHGALLALGSGSKKRRRRAVVLGIDGREVVDGSAPRVVDASPLYEALDKEIDDVNIEGALVSGDRLLLMHRGNKSHSTNALATFSLPAILHSFAHDDELGKTHLLALTHYDLGGINGVPLCFTDGVELGAGSILFSAVAEDTADSYHDGPCVGAAIGTIGADGKVQAIEYLDELYKVEGVHAERDGDTIKLWLVTDADDVTVPALLLSGEWHRP